MERDTEITEVIFREETDGTILALFPYNIGTTKFMSCECYALLGQHGAADYDYCIKKTKPAKEFSEIKTELESLGYNLKVITKINMNKYRAEYKKSK